MSFIAQNAGDSISVVVVNQSAPAAASTATDHALYITDSANASIHTTAQTCATGIPVALTLASVNCAPGFQKDYGPRGATGGVAPADYSNTVAAYVGTTASSGGALSASFAWRLSTINAAGTYVFRAYLVAGTGTTYTTVSTPQTITVTVTANTSSVASATYSTAYMNRADEFPAASGRISSIDNHGAKGIESDSTLVVSAGSTLNENNSALAVWTPIVRNSSDTKVGTVTTADGSVGNLRVKDSVVVTMTGPGLLAASSYWSGVGAAGTRAKQVTINWNESVVVYADGTAGVGTITGYVTSLSAANKFAQATKSITFVGRATTFTVSGYSAAVRAGSAVRYAGAADSATAAAEAIRFLATDAAGNAVTSSLLNVQQGEGATGNFFAISSDTSVIAAGEVGATYATSLARRSPALPCTYDATSSVAGYWYCTGRVYDSGTVTLTIVDSRTVTPNGANYLTTTTSAVTASAAFSVTFAGNGNTGTIAFDKTTTSYNINERATLTLTCKDGAGRVVADGQYTGCFNNLSWKAGTPLFGEDSSANAAGGRFTNLVTYLGTTGPTFVGGTDTALVYMPTVAGTYTLQGRTGTATAISDLLTFTVVDPVAAAQSAAIAAAEAAAAKAGTDAVAAAAAAQAAATAAATTAGTDAVAASAAASAAAVAASAAAQAAAEKAGKDAVAAAAAAQAAATAAADAATDAALEAIDAANAATDAANLSAEAADAATVAAEEARDAADAATASVEALATEVATLMAALKAQITTLANTVAKIAKKVKA